MLNNVEKFIKQLVSDEEYESALNYDESKITLAEQFENKNGHNFIFNVDNFFSENMVSIIFKDHTFKYYCDCYSFRLKGSCEHLAACLVCYSNEIFGVRFDNYKIEQKSKLFLNNLKQNYHQKSVGIKKKIQFFNLKIKIIMTSVIEYPLN